jgi:hypothetical protein
LASFFYIVIYIATDVATLELNMNDDVIVLARGLFSSRPDNL